MTPVLPLPRDDQDFLREQSPAGLIVLMIENEDRVPRNVIDECARRGEVMADALAPWAISSGEAEERPGHWWLRLHAIMILGLIPGERSASVLLEYIRNLCEDSEENLQEWFAGFWPALTRNKPAMLIEQLRTICLDQNIGWFMRANLLEAVIAAAQREGGTQLEAALDWAAHIAADETEDWNMRLLTAGDLLNFPRERHRALLEDLAARQTGFGVHFTKQDVASDYACNSDKPDWSRHENPWQFYEPQAIEARQVRWAKENFVYEEDDDFPDEPYYTIQEPYMREIPKIGRNDPCPCGSGKKYKKCCLSKV